MSARSLRARLDKLGQPPAAEGPVCRYHGQACQLGARWPLPYPEDPLEETRTWFREARIRRGAPVEPDPREVWATDRHERVPDAELQQQAEEMRVLLAELKAKNARIEAELTADRDARREDW